jgi:UDP:flavonoid glycosyltransferase YjiC (YdhE family)
MAKIALVWELGADLGHITRLRTIGTALRARGHDPVFILRDISRAHQLLADTGMPWLQTPIWMVPVMGLPPEINFTETLLRFGFLHPEELKSMIGAWRQMFALVKPELMIFDHAPTAQLASRGLGIPRIATGNSFACPPRTSPMPPFRFWESPPPSDRLAETEARVVRNANTALASFDMPLLRTVAELFDVERSLVLANAPLDVYDRTDKSALIGPINGVDFGELPQWPHPTMPKGFAYLKPIYGDLNNVLNAMRSSGAQFLIYAPGAAPALRQQWTSPTMRFSEKPFKMALMRESCDFAICHAGGMVDVMLKTGRPLLLLPMQMEQLMTSVRAEKLGCAAVHQPGMSADMLKAKLRTVIEDPSMAASAQAYAKTTTEPSASFIVDTFIQACESLLSSKPVHE